MGDFIRWPKQKLSYSAKNKKWRKMHLDWADKKTFFNYSPIRNSTIHKKINYDLLNGKLHMQDLELILNPENIQTAFNIDKIQHYPIINAKLQVLRGEESARVFDFKAVVTNPNDVSEIENNKKKELLEKVQQLIQDSSSSEEEFNQKLEELSDYYTYQWQDMREIRVNSLLNHYVKELNIPQLFNEGFMDAMIVGEEIYQVDVVGGEPSIVKLNPLKVRAFKSGYSNRVEDADIIIIEDYWSPGKIIDYYYDVLTKKDIEYIENMPDHVGQSSTDSMDNYDDRVGFINNYMIGDEITSQNGFFWAPLGTSEGVSNSLMPYDLAGNIRVLKVYWKSWRKIKKVKSYDFNTGEEIYDFYPEDYIINPDNGEEETIYWINEAWEGTKIGSDIYVNMRPRVLQFNRLSNPSRCHFGIIGTIYNLNDSRPFSLVDIMKPYAYLYDVTHDRVNKLIAKNWGKIITLDLAKVPAKWDIQKWLYYAKTNNIAVVDSFKEGNIGASTGKLAGALNNAYGVLDAELGNSIQSNLNLLEYIKNEMSETAGISKQREGQISNRETVGGVERATLQSSHITEWLFAMHEDLKKRVLEAFIEVAKIAIKGNNKKFQYILSDGSRKMVDINGDEFAECDYGIVVDNSNGLQELNQKLDILTQAAIQNGYSLSVITKLYTSQSVMEKIRMLENAEAKMQRQQQQAQEQQLKQQEQAIQMQEQTKKEEMQFRDTINQRDNETKIKVAEINARAEDERFAMMQGSNSQTLSATDKAKLLESQRQFDATLKLQKEKLSFNKDKADKDRAVREKQIIKSNNN